MLENKKNIVALILAAGASSRLGQAKQNLPFQNTTLLNHIKEHLNLNIVEQTFIVLGAYAHDVQKKCGLEDSEIIKFENWEEGMGSSLSYACSEIFSKKAFDGILITLSDLPLVDAADYRKMIDQFHSEHDIVATKANNTIGVPAIFGAAYFNELLKLKGRKGAKGLILKYIDNVKIYVNDNAVIDIDTMENYSALIGPKN